MFMHDIVESAAYRFADQVALSDNYRNLSFRDLWERANRLAWALLECGVVAGDRVVISMPNRAEFVESDVAISLIGAIRGRLNVRDSAREWQLLLDDLEPVVVICTPDIAEKLQSIELCRPPRFLVVGPQGNYEAALAAAQRRALPNVDPDAVGMATHTSGTTGVLKAALYTHRKLLRRHLNCLAIVMEDVTPQSVILHVAPVTHMSGHMIVPGLFRGARSVMMERFSEADFFEMVERHGVTHTLLPPTIINRLTAYREMHPGSTPTLRRILYAASPIAPAHLERAMRVFGPIFMQGYSSTEAGGLFNTILYPEEHVRALESDRTRLLSCGRPTPFFDIRIVDDSGTDLPPGEAGEIWVRGDSVSIGYWNRPEATEAAYADGWFKTGDIAKRDEEGYITILDRKHDMIVSGGFNIYPTEVENVLVTHPSVVSVAVVGVPHDAWGEAVQACVVLKPGAELSLDSLQQHCLQAGLASYKKPLALDLVSELPSGATGKVSRRSLKERYWHGHARHVA